MNFLSRAWYRQSAWLWLLLPLSLVVRYVAVQRLRTLQKASKSGHIEALSCPVIVVETYCRWNGEDTFIIALANHLKKDSGRRSSAEAIRVSRSVIRFWSMTGFCLRFR